MSNHIKQGAKVLIVSWSPVPTPKYQKIEGSGQRFFGLASGLQKNGVKDITIGVGTIYPLDVTEVDGIKLFNYDFNDVFIEELAEYDTIIFNYTIHGSAFIAENIPKNTQVIIDAYGPAYIENLARDPTDLIGTYVGNLAAVREVFNVVMARGDYFLYANEAQEKFYAGVLATLGVLNQFSFNAKRLLRVPFGIEKPALHKQDYPNPYLDYGTKKNDFILLWFGGLYPWFDITKILDMLKRNDNKHIKFVIVGGNNPQNQHPDFIKHYHDTITYIEKNGLSDQIILIDWADYTTRRQYYEHADVIISLNRASHENIYSWRTRVMDYVGSTTPLITNGGDPLSEELINIGAAFRVDERSDSSISQTINDLVNDKSKLTSASRSLKQLQPKYYWETVTRELAEVIQAQTKPYSDEQNFRLQNGILNITTHGNPPTVRSKSIKSMAGVVVRKAQSDGVGTTYKIIQHKIQRRAAFEYRKRFPNVKPSKPRIIIVSNQLNNTGAPFVIMDIVKHIKQLYPKLIRSIRFIAFTPIEAINVSKLEKDGVRVAIHTNRELLLELNQNDVVVLNTFAISHTTAYPVIEAVKAGKVKKLYWYGHEHSPDGFINSDVKRELVRLLKSDKAKVYAVSSATQREYIKFLGTSKNVEKMTFPFLFPADKFRTRAAEDFSELRFITTGSLMDMRKGQYPILYAFLNFYHGYYKRNPETYRNFKVEFIGAYEKSDLGPQAAYHVKNIKRQFDLSASGLDKHFKMTPTLSHEKAIENIEKANVTICYSLYEALGIFVYEGMATGHPIIRNESAGQEEQLKDGKNGYAVSSTDFAGLVAVIERMLNKQTTSNQELAVMSKLSNKIAKQATIANYQIVDDLHTVFNSID